MCHRHAGCATIGTRSASFVPFGCTRGADLHQAELASELLGGRDLPGVAVFVIVETIDVVVVVIGVLGRHLARRCSQNLSLRARVQRWAHRRDERSDGRRATAGPKDVARPLARTPKDSNHNLPSLISVACATTYIVRYALCMIQLLACGSETALSIESCRRKNILRGKAVLISSGRNGTRREEGPNWGRE